MADGWVAVLAAVLGLLGGMGGAAIGGYVANKGQEQRFEHERASEKRDLRIDTYVKFLRATEAEHTEAPATADRIVRTAEAEVALVANTDVRRAAAILADNALNPPDTDTDYETAYRRLRDRFIDRTQAETGTGK